MDRRVRKLKQQDRVFKQKVSWETFCGVWRATITCDQHVFCNKLINCNECGKVPALITALRFALWLHPRSFTHLFSLNSFFFQNLILSGRRPPQNPQDYCSFFRLFKPKWCWFTAPVENIKPIKHDLIHKWRTLRRTLLSERTCPNGTLCLVFTD